LQKTDAARSFLYYSFITLALRIIVVATLVCGSLARIDVAGGQQRARFDPTRPAASGYRIVFNEPFADPARVDLNGEGPQTTWFREPFFGWKPSPFESIRVSSGVLELGGPSGAASVSLATPAVGGEGWRGRTFGGGFFVEASIALGPIVEEKGWPAFWSMAVEHMAARGGAQVPGKPAGYERFAENDFFEADTGYAGPDSYGTALHDWWGQFRRTCPSGFCGVMNNGYDAPRGNVARGLARIDWSKFHVVAQLWSPATPTRAGFVQNYLDGRATTRTEWQRYDPTAPLPPGRGQMFSIIDRQHLVIVLNGSLRALKVDWLRVWQASGAITDVRTINRGQ
jgi:hypothetical protein